MNAQSEETEGIRLAPGAALVPVGDELLVHLPQAGGTFHLTAHGAHVVRLLEQSLPLGELLESLGNRFPYADRETIHADVLALLANLEAHGIIDDMEDPAM